MSACIRPEELYPLPSAKSITGWGDSALRSARRGGLKLLYLHGRVFVRGAELIRYIEEAACDQAPTSRRAS